MISTGSKLKKNLVKEDLGKQQDRESLKKLILQIDRIISKMHNNLSANTIEDRERFCASTLEDRKILNDLILVGEKARILNVNMQGFDVDGGWREMEENWNKSHKNKEMTK